MYTEAFDRNDIPTRMRKTADGKSVIFNKTNSISISKNKKITILKYQRNTIKYFTVPHKFLKNLFKF